MDRKLIAVAVSSALALPMAAQAVEFSVSGHVNRVIISQDGGGSDGSLQHMDANSSESRFRFTGSQELDNGMTAGVQLEMARPHNIRVRHSNVYLSSAGGKVTIGQQSVAADGAINADLGGASWLGGATPWCSYQSNTTTPACPSNDGGRKEVLRYDTPAIGAASVSASMGNDDYWDGMVKVAGSMGDSGYDVRLGYIDTTEAVIASAAFSMGQGTSVALAWSQADSNDHDTQYVKLDHSYGDGSIAVYYKRGATGDVEGSLWGVGLGHSLGGGATAYAGWRRTAGDDLAEDISLLVAGMRVTFN